MPFFGGSRQKRPVHATTNYSSVNLPAQPYYASPSPPPPYSQQFNSPPQQYPYPGPSPYSCPQLSSTELVLRPHTQTGQLYNPPLPPVGGWSSCVNLPTTARPAVNTSPSQGYNGQGLHDFIGDKFSDVVSLIDEEAFTGGEKELIISLDQAPLQTPFFTPPPQYNQPAIRGGVGNEKALIPWSRDKKRPPDKPKQQVYAQERSINVTSKINMYANSRLPPSLPPLRLYTASWPLIYLASKFSNKAYQKAVGAERDTFVRPDNRLGTKAMVIKSVPIDDMSTIVFAIRGTSLLSLRDWGVNMDTEPVPPTNFLDDQGNLCHSGFLRVARAMAAPIAARLRHLLEENPSRTTCSLLITGHSAGAAVASLLYAHMLAETPECRSELNNLTGCFKRIHCITFGAPPVTLLPLWKPANSERRLRRSLFLSFINEGDIVARAEKPYLFSVFELLASPSPNSLKAAMNAGKASSSRLDLSRISKPQNQNQNVTVWKLPPATLSNAGRLVVLRQGRDGEVSASVVTDQQLRGVIFGNPIVHMMDIYARRIGVLAHRAVEGGV